MTTRQLLALIARGIFRFIWRFAQWMLFGLAPPLWRLFWVRVGRRVSESGINYTVKEIVDGKIGCYSDLPDVITVFDRLELGPAIPWRR
jgi:hypothetical protein